MPDVLGAVTRAHESAASTTVSKEVAQIGKWVCNSHQVQYHEKSLLRYAKAVTKLDLAFLEDIREYCAAGLEAFDAVRAKDITDEKEVCKSPDIFLNNIAGTLLTKKLLHRRICSLPRF